MGDPHHNNSMGDPHHNNSMELVQLDNHARTRVSAVGETLHKRQHAPRQPATTPNFLQRIPRGLCLKFPIPPLGQCPCICGVGSTGESGEVDSSGGVDRPSTGGKQKRATGEEGKVKKGLRGRPRGPSWSQVRRSLAKGVLLGRPSGTTSERISTATATATATTTTTATRGKAMLWSKAVVKDNGVVMDTKMRDKRLSDNIILRDTALRDSVLRNSTLRNSTLVDDALRNSTLSDSALNDSTLSGSALRDSTLSGSSTLSDNNSTLRDSVFLEGILNEAEFDLSKSRVAKPKKVAKIKKPPQPKDHDVCYKVLLIGDSGVGKTALVRAASGHDFMQKTLTTVGMDFVSTILNVDGARVKLQIWDTAGQERFRSMTKFQFRGTQGALLAYDITDRESFKTLKYWLQMIDNEIDQSNKEPIPVFLIGNKSDIVEQRKVAYKKGIQLSQEHIMRGFLETSAKTNKNVTEAFTQLAQSIVEINNPKLLDSYLDRLEKTEKYEQKQREADLIVQYQLQKQKTRIKLPSSISRPKSMESVHKCCSS